MLNLQEIERLVDLVASSRVAGVTVEMAGRRVSVEKGREPPRPPRRSATRSAPSEAPSMEESPGDSVPGGRWITAPMVGVYHHLEEPVSVGARVEPGDVVGMIESMKLMNDVCAETGGIVVEVVAEDGQPAEFGHRLFRLEEMPESDIEESV